MRSHFINSSFVFHQDFQTLENNKRIRPSASCLMKHSSSFMKHFILPAIKSLHIERECFRKPQSFCYHFFKFLIHITWIVKRRRRYVSGLVRLKEVNTSLIYPRNKILSNPLNRLRAITECCKTEPKAIIEAKKNTRKISQGNEHSM